VIVSERRMHSQTDEAALIEGVGVVLGQLAGQVEHGLIAEFAVGIEQRNFAQLIGNQGAPAVNRPRKPSLNETFGDEFKRGFRRSQRSGGEDEARGREFEHGVHAAECSD